MSAIQERGPHLRFQFFFFLAGAAGFAGGGVDRVCLWKVFMENRVPLIFCQDLAAGIRCSEQAVMVLIESAGSALRPSHGGSKLRHPQHEGNHKHS